ncbi:hypothetical protein [Hyphomicrobium sp.]|uniref:hypothetical protein n=1 Tax=Hyphomicrobium sp. TaxID=82 RepID=UPI0025BD7566|nr:hypothetical protein [Hyphomicrobium sp.]MCC7253158.1 hypothetical protein [Hyphomicrobium sp.]
MAEDAQLQNDVQERQEIAALLASGLETEVFPRADTHEGVQEIIARLRRADGDLKSKLVIAGFTDYPVEHGGIEQPCETCMYYLVHRRYCELPELDCPVEPQWSCRLWRI